MKADPRVISDLQSGANTLATIAAQCRIDKHQLKGIDLDWLAKRVQGWYKCAEKHLDILLKRLVKFEAAPVYQVGKLTGDPTDIPGLLKRNLASSQAALDAFISYRKNAWNIRADGTTDDFEHVVQFLESMVFKCERELRLIDGLGLPGYIGARLEDG